MTTVLLVRHGRTTANDAGVLAGWTEGVSLDDTGQAQVRALAARLAPVPLVAVVTSPLQRCRETTDAACSGAGTSPVHPDDRLGEVRYGEWSGQELKKLAKEPALEGRAVPPVGGDVPRRGRGVDAGDGRPGGGRRTGLERRLGSDKKESVYAVVSHGDVIKAVLADALGMHLDQFQRIVVDPGSVERRPLHAAAARSSLRVNDVGGDLSVPGAAARARGAGARQPRPTPPSAAGAVPPDSA